MSIMIHNLPGKWCLSSRGTCQLFKSPKTLRIGALQLAQSSFECGVSENFEMLRARPVFWSTFGVSEKIFFLRRVWSGEKKIRGVGDEFKTSMIDKPYLFNDNKPIECLYISPSSMYKHQWNVVRAIAVLRQNEMPIKLTLIGGGTGKSQELIQKAIEKSDPNHEYVRQLPFVPQQELPIYLAKSDIFSSIKIKNNLLNI